MESFKNRDYILIDYFIIEFISNYRKLLKMLYINVQIVNNMI